MRDWVCLRTQIEGPSVSYDLMVPVELQDVLARWLPDVRLRAQRDMVISVQEDEENEVLSRTTDMVLDGTTIVNNVGDSATTWLVGHDVTGEEKLHQSVSRATLLRKRTTRRTTRRGFRDVSTMDGSFPQVIKRRQDKAVTAVV